MAHILVVDDEEKIRHLLSIILERNGHNVAQACDGMEAFEMVKSSPFDMVITDIKMPRMDGTELLNKIKEEDLSCPVVFITAFATVESAVETMRQGAVDYIVKPFDEDQILLAVERTLKLSRIMSENRELRQNIEKLAGDHNIVYQSDQMSKIVELASKVAKTDSAVLITGESGTGKELFARFIHFESMRSKGRFVPVNCAAISPHLVESELFGYEKGAFTGADRKTQGKFEFASGGTLILDEVGDLPLEAQAKLLRALEEKKMRRVGGNEEIDIDVRVICITNRNLTDLVQKGGFREDLFFRINVFPIHPPPLRERPVDIVPLARHFLENMNDGPEIRLTQGAIRILKEYTWPGNVRELANAMERAVILSADQGTITSETLSFLKVPGYATMEDSNFQLPPGGISLEALQKDIVRQALEMSSNNQTNAAKLLGLTRAKFRVLMKQTIA
jgi:DNA-binding NtrC family response regulator